MSLKQLTLRVCMLLALVTGQREHAFHFLKVEDIKLKKEEDKIEKIKVHYPLFRETQAVKARLSCGTSQNISV